jgi:hypothetical protein
MQNEPQKGTEEELPQKAQNERVGFVKKLFCAFCG